MNTFFALALAFSLQVTDLKVGDRAPSFALGNMYSQLVSSKDFAGRPAVLVIGTAKEAAPDCREWMLTLAKNYNNTGVAVYQVIVLNNPWFIPHALVMSELRDFVPAHGRKQVLLEWKTGFGDAYGIPYDFETRLVVLDKDGVIRLWQKGKMNDERLVRVMSLVAELDG